MISYSVLLVEDDEVDVMNIERMFNKLNITNDLHVVNNGEEAIEFLENNQIHPLVILLDINMPKMNGLDFLTELRRRRHHLASIPVVILTTSDNDKDLESAYKMHVAGYLLKPVKVEDFTSLINKFSNYWETCKFPVREAK